jgi:hypothetical protein
MWNQDLRAARRAAGHTQLAMMRAAGIEGSDEALQSRASDYERGRYRPRGDREVLDRYIERHLPRQAQPPDVGRSIADIKAEVASVRGVSPEQVEIVIRL